MRNLATKFFALAVLILLTGCIDKTDEPIPFTYATLEFKGVEATESLNPDIVPVPDEYSGADASYHREYVAGEKPGYHFVVLSADESNFSLTTDKADYSVSIVADYQSYIELGKTGTGAWDYGTISLETPNDSRTVKVHLDANITSDNRIIDIYINGAYRYAHVVVIQLHE